MHGEPVVDVAAQSYAVTWSEDAVGGIDVVVLDDGQVAREWSFPGARAHRI